MKQILFKNPLFYLSVVLAFALGFRIMYNVYGQGVWQEPACPPPGCLPYPPLDTGPFGQVKQSDPNRPDLTINDLFVTGRFDVRGRLYVGSLVNDGVMIENADSMIKFGPEGIDGAVIRFNRGSGKLEARHSFASDVGGEFFDIGTGSGGGGQWQNVTGGGHYI